MPVFSDTRSSAAANISDHFSRAILSYQLARFTSIHGTWRELCATLPVGGSSSAVQTLQLGWQTADHQVQCQRDKHTIVHNPDERNSNIERIHRV
jgi:hypothetical protein